MPALFISNKKWLALRNSKGFTIIEAVLATSIFTIGVLGAFAVVQMVTGFTSSVSSRLQATYLAQEGIENIRNIRDSNWLVQGVWDEGISTTDWETIDKFQRKISISKPQSDKMVVSVQIAWPERGGTSQVAAETELYDWK